MNEAAGHSGVRTATPIDAAGGMYVELSRIQSAVENNHGLNRSARGRAYRQPNQLATRPAPRLGHRSAARSDATLEEERCGNSRLSSRSP